MIDVFANSFWDIVYTEYHVLPSEENSSCEQILEARGYRPLNKMEISLSTIDNLPKMTGYSDNYSLYLKDDKIYSADKVTLDNPRECCTIQTITVAEIGKAKTHESNERNEPESVWDVLYGIK